MGNKGVFDGSADAEDRSVKPAAGVGPAMNGEMGLHWLMASEMCAGGMKWARHFFQQPKCGLGAGVAFWLDKIGPTDSARMG